MDKHKGVGMLILINLIVKISHSDTLPFESGSVSERLILFRLQILHLVCIQLLSEKFSVLLKVSEM